MEFSYIAVKQMDVISVADGKHLGKVCDLVFEFPENRLRGFYVTGSKGFRFTRQEIFLPIDTVVRIGEDVIIVDAGGAPPKGKPCRKRQEGNDPREECPPEYFRSGRQGERRSYDEYE